MKEIYILKLNYKINFHDADDGDCFAGDGTTILRAYADKGVAEGVVKTWNPVFKLAGNETTIFPVQANNRKVKKEFGFTLDNIDDGYDFALSVESMEVIG
jgi:hypothetical protein